jgi:hypothetical protein
MRKFCFPGASSKLGWESRQAKPERIAHAERLARGGFADLPLRGRGNPFLSDDLAERGGFEPAESKSLGGQSLLCFKILHRFPGRVPFQVFLRPEAKQLASQQAAEGPLVNRVACATVSNARRRDDGDAKVHRQGGRTKLAEPCRGNSSSAGDCGQPASFRHVERAPTLPSSPRLAIAPQAPCARIARGLQPPANLENHGHFPALRIPLTGCPL